MRACLETIKLSCTEKFSGGVPALLGSYLLEGVYFLPLLFLWRSFAAAGVDLGGFTLAQLLSYTCVSACLTQQLNVKTLLSSWNYEGTFINLCLRPQTIFAQIAAHTIGGWLPRLLLFTLPMAIILSLFGVNLLPASPWFPLCLLLSMSLGFAVDLLFSCFIIRMQRAQWCAYVIRSAIHTLLSGALIPFDLLPWGMGNLFKLLPYGSLAGAPLALFIGRGDPLPLIGLQIFWNLILWSLAALVFRKTQETMVSYGG
jgi:ABC-2 type transport system permease protein